MTPDITKRLGELMMDLGGGSLSTPLVFSGKSLADFAQGISARLVDDRHAKVSLHALPDAKSIRERLVNLAIEQESFAIVRAKRIPLVSEDVIKEFFSEINKWCPPPPTISRTA